MVRVQAQAVDAEARRDSALAARDLALQEQEQAQEVVAQARASLINQLCERADNLGHRLDKFERVRARNYMDTLPDPDNVNPGGELSPIGPATFHDPATAEVDQIPDPDDPTGTSLQMDQFGGGTTVATRQVNDPSELGKADPVSSTRQAPAVELHKEDRWPKH
jgi:hypothetical protein